MVSATVRINQGFPTPRITTAIADDVAELTEIAVSAKRHWGYPTEWMELWREDLTVSPAQVACGWTFAAWLDDGIVGWCGLEPTPPRAEIDGCWVRPKYMGRGIGACLLDHALSRAIDAGIGEMIAVADPHAEGFYQRRGFERIGVEPSVPLGRFLPVMRQVLRD